MSLTIRGTLVAKLVNTYCLCLKTNVLTLKTCAHVLNQIIVVLVDRNVIVKVLPFDLILKVIMTLAVKWISLLIVASAVFCRMAMVIV